MYKNTAISALSAVVAVLCLPELPANEKAGLAVGIATCLFIFLLFLEDLSAKIMQIWTQKRRSRQHTEEIIRHLRELNIWEDRHAG